jgi:hypothetical protein
MSLSSRDHWLVMVGWMLLGAASICMCALTPLPALVHLPPFPGGASCSAGGRPDVRLGQQIRLLTRRPRMDTLLRRTRLPISVPRGRILYRCHAGFYTPCRSMSMQGAQMSYVSCLLNGLRRRLARVRSAGCVPITPVLCVDDAATRRPSCAVLPVPVWCTAGVQHWCARLKQREAFSQGSASVACSVNAAYMPTSSKAGN